MSAALTETSDRTKILSTQDTAQVVAGDIWAQELSVVAAQFVEAACRARDGDLEATRAHVSHALSLLKGIPSLAPSGTNLLFDPKSRAVEAAYPCGRREGLARTPKETSLQGSISNSSHDSSA